MPGRLSDAELAEMRAVNRAQRNLTDDARLFELGILEARHPAKPPHEQWMHAGAKGRVKKVAATTKKAGGLRVGQDALDAVPVGVTQYRRGDSTAAESGSG